MFERYTRKRRDRDEMVLFSKTSPAKRRTIRLVQANRNRFSQLDHNDNVTHRYFDESSRKSTIMGTITRGVGEGTGRGGGLVGRSIVYLGPTWVTVVLLIGITLLNKVRTVEDRGVAHGVRRHDPEGQHEARLAPLGRQIRHLEHARRQARCGRQQPSGVGVEDLQDVGRRVRVEVLALGAAHPHGRPALLADRAILRRGWLRQPLTCCRKWHNTPASAFI